MTINNDWTKKLQSTSQSQTCTTKRSWSLFGGLLPIWSTTTFWILTKPLPLRNVLTNRWDVPKIAVPEAGIVNRKCPILHDNAQLQVAQLTFQKLTELAMKFWLIRHRHLTSHWLPLLQTSWQLIAGKNAPQQAERKKKKKKISKSLLNPEAWIFMLQE